MDDQQKMRASDADREQVVERLRTALDEGRLKTDEYLARMERAYQAVTYGDLAVLYAGLPASSPVARREQTAPGAARQAAAVPHAAVAARHGLFARLPAPLKVLWTIWLAVVSINVVVWVLVMGTTGHLVYPWPVWVAGPYGAVLFAVSVAVPQGRRDRRPRSLPRGEG